MIKQKINVSFQEIDCMKCGSRRTVLNTMYRSNIKPVLQTQLWNYHNNSWKYSTEKWICTKYDFAVNNFCCQVNFYISANSHKQPSTQSLQNKKIVINEKLKRLPNNSYWSTNHINAKINLKIQQGFI